MTTLHLRKSISRLPWRGGFLLIPLVLACFALLPSALAVTPAPDGGYPGANTAEGVNALLNRTTGVFDTAIGAASLSSANTGSNNTALGANSLRSLTSGGANTALGVAALFRNNGNSNTAVGFNALFNNTSGIQNAAVGQGALAINTGGSDNTAMGFQALNSITADMNTGVGFQAMQKATGSSATFNTAIGFRALPNATGNANVAVGDLTLPSQTSGAFNTAIGAAAGFFHQTGDNNIYIGQGSFGVANESHTCYIQEIFGKLSSGGALVFVNSAGKLGTSTSSKRFKDEIKPMDKASEALFELKPVTFRYKKEIEPKPIPQWGLVAEDVEKVNPDLVVRDAEGKVNTVRYDQVYNMMLNEFLKEHQKVQELEATVAQQQKGMEALVAQVKEQAAQIQKVSAQVGMSKPAPKVVANQ
jgi:hypothetical protein